VHLDIFLFYIVINIKLFLSSYYDLMSIKELKILQNGMLEYVWQYTVDVQGKKIWRHWKYDFPPKLLNAKKTFY